MQLLDSMVLCMYFFFKKSMRLHPPIHHEIEKAIITKDIPYSPAIDANCVRTRLLCCDTANMFHEKPPKKCPRIHSRITHIAADVIDNFHKGNFVDSLQVKYPQIPIYIPRYALREIQPNMAPIGKGI